MKRFSRFWTLVAALMVALLALPSCQQQTTPGEGTEGAESGSADVEQAGPRTATLPEGTTLRVRTMNTLSTKAVKTGETFSATLEEPIVDGTWVIALKGATVTGKIANSDPGGKVKGRASLAVRLTELHTADGQRVPINTDTYATQAKTSKKEDAKKIGIGSGVGAAIGAIAGGGKGAAVGAAVGAGAGTGAVLATRGDPAVIPSESVITFRLQNPVTVTEND